MHDQHRHHKPLPPRGKFFLRLARSAAIALGLIAAALGVGMIGYHGFEGMGWLDAFLNASMILAGMGPADQLHTDGGKVFAGCYALFSGVIFITMAAVLFGPVLHRFLHRMHLDIEQPCPHDHTGLSADSADGSDEAKKPPRL